MKTAGSPTEDLHPEITKIMSTGQDLANLDWRKIYHTGPIDFRRPEESDIISRRMAEVIIPGHLGYEESEMDILSF